MSFSIPELQSMIGIWAARNFPCADRTRTTLRCALGVCEEAGELAHAVLKADECIRGTEVEHDAEAMDAIGDVVIYLMHLCHIKGWDLESILDDTADAVLKRNWVDDPTSGGEVAP